MRPVCHGHFEKQTTMVQTMIASIQNTPLPLPPRLLRVDVETEKGPARTPNLIG